MISSPERPMLGGLTRVDGGGAALPFVRMFFRYPSEYLWEDEVGIVHRIPQREGGEQGDAMMPLLFSLGQHEALEDVHRQLRAGEYLFAFLDDIYLVTPPDRAGACSVCSVGGRSSTGPCVHSHPHRENEGVEPRGCETRRMRCFGTDRTGDRSHRQKKLTDFGQP